LESSNGLFCRNGGDVMANARQHEGGPSEPGPGGLTRRDLLKKQAAVGAGYFAADALLGGSLAERAAASTNVTLHPQFYPLSSFTPEIDLRGKLAVITGASTGIGRAAGAALAARGVRVIGTSRDVASVSHPPNFTLLNLDITETRSIKSFVSRVRRHVGATGHVDILINNAGRGIVGNVLPPNGGEDKYFEQLQLGFKTDYTGHLMMTEKMLPLLPTRGYARVYFTVSVAAYSVSTNVLTYLHGYTAMKRALLASANAWRSTLKQAHSNIGVTTVNPYDVNTRFPYNLILTEKAARGSVIAQYVALLRQAFAESLPASLVGKAYWQLLSTNQPPANVAAGSSAEPYATMGSNQLFETAILAENGQAAVEFGC
jgi:NAD(P)-dependent dehydrogenase (short-subunit alcohol dehydrogenase family)